MPHNINDEQMSIIGGTAVNISITLKQLELVSRKIDGGTDSTPVELQELNNLSEMIKDIIKDPGKDGLHGFAL